MNLARLICCLTMSASVLIGLGGGSLVQDQQTPAPPMRIKRAKRPVFTERDWDGIYFRDLLKEGLVGERPTDTRPKAAPVNPMVDNSGADSEGPAAAGDGWSAIIAPGTLENEIKRLEQELRSKLSTPGRFKSDYAEFHQMFSVLSALMGIIMEYDSDVRWKDQAPEVLASVARAAANARVGTVQAFQYSKQQIEYLTEMVRGGNFSGTEPPVETMEWGEIAWRSPLMQRLEQAMSQSLKPDLASNTEFTSNIERVMHEAEIVGALARVLCQEGMDEADEEDYVQYARAMQQAALELVQAARQQNYDQAAQAANAIEQSCSDCHAEWR